MGEYHHVKGGKYANPPSMPSVRNYQPGGVANFEFDATTNVRESPISGRYFFVSHNTRIH